jgi:hypothetical protein
MPMPRLPRWEEEEEEEKDGRTGGKCHTAESNQERLIRAEGQNCGGSKGCGRKDAKHRVTGRAERGEGTDAGQF